MVSYDSDPKYRIDVPGALTLFHEQSRDYRHGDKVTSLKFDDVGIYYRLDPETGPSALWKWSDLDKAVVELINFFLKKEIEPRRLDAYMYFANSLRRRDNYCQLVMSTRRAGERINFYLAVGPGVSLHGSMATKPKPILSTAGVLNAIALWKWKYHRHWGNPLIKNQRDFIHGKDNVNFDFWVFQNQSPSGRKFYHKDIANSLDILYTYVRTHLEGVWRSTTVYMYEVSPDRPRTIMFFIHFYSAAPRI